MSDPRYARPGLEHATGKAVEEMGELHAAIGKAMRWGWESSNPELPQHERETNRTWALRECNDVLEAVLRLRAYLSEPFPSPGACIFQPRDRVAKVSGYPFPGVVAAAFLTLAGEVRYVVEADHPDFRGMLHIFSGAQIELRDAKP